MDAEIFKKKFIEDASELLQSLEKDLLELENDKNNSELIESIFRAMHSLKGASGMYGFHIIGELTHALENIFDDIRNGELNVNKDVLSVSLQSVDHIRKLLETNNPETLANNQEALKAAIESIGNTLKKQYNQNNNQQNEDNHQQKKITNTFYILLEPDDDVSERGVNLLALFDELHEVGKTKIIPHHTNEVNDNGVPFTYWEIFIATHLTKNEIEDIFIFVEDEIKLVHLATVDLLAVEEFVKNVKKIAAEKSKISEDILHELTENAINEQSKKVVNTHIEKGIKHVFHKTASVRVDAQKLDVLMNLVSELITKQSELNIEAERLRNRRMLDIATEISKTSRMLRDNALSIRLIPIASLSVQLKRLVRDLSADLGKNIDFEEEGSDTELDKTVIDALASPLMHIIRNSIDHGIESTKKRKELNKPETGKILLKAYNSSTSVIIKVKDDGAGINIDKVKQTAIKKGLIDANIQLTTRQAINLLFRPGFTTSENISEVSGRGVGMDVVKKEISAIRGNLSIDTKKNIGTTVTISVPLTLSIIDTLQIKTGSSYFILPLSEVEVCIEKSSKELKSTNNRQIEHAGNLIPYFDINRELELGCKNVDSYKLVVVNSGGVRIGLLTHSIVGEHQAVLKPLGSIFKKQELLAGASVLGDGNVALMIDTGKLQSYLMNTV